MSFIHSYGQSLILLIAQEHQILNRSLNNICKKPIFQFPVEDIEHIKYSFLLTYTNLIIASLFNKLTNRVFCFLF